MTTMHPLLVLDLKNVPNSTKKKLAISASFFPGFVLNATLLSLSLSREKKRDR